MKRSVGMVLFWILGTVAIWMAFYAIRGLFRDMSFHTIDSTDMAVLISALFGIPAYYVWRFMVR